MDSEIIVNHVTLFTNKHYQDNNVNKIYNENNIKICSKCNQSNPETDFHKDESKSDGLRSCCNSCLLIYTTNYRDNYKKINAKIFLIIMMLKYVLNVNNKNCILNFINVQQNH